MPGREELVLFYRRRSAESVTNGFEDTNETEDVGGKHGIPER